MNRNFTCRRPERSTLGNAMESTAYVITIQQRPQLSVLESQVFPSTTLFIISSISDLPKTTVSHSI
jgi:hypothetical protein